MPQVNLFEDQRPKASGADATPIHATFWLPTFPRTRFQGSKRKVLPELSVAFSKLEFNSALDLYSGSGMVTLLLRYLGKKVHANDYQRFACTTAEVFLALQGSECAKRAKILEDLEDLLHRASIRKPELVTERYENIFFTDTENREIDRFAQNINQYSEPYRSLLIYAVGQALLKKRPYNLFHRANLHMRTTDVPRSFGNAATWETSIIEHSIQAIEDLAKFPFSSLRCDGVVSCVNTSGLDSLPGDFDLVYLDPPYLNRRGVVVDYSDFYGFLDGLCQYELFAEGDVSYPHRPIQKKPSNWNDADSALLELRRIAEKWPRSVLFLSYRSDGQLAVEDVHAALSANGRRVEVHTCGEYKYALSTTDTNEELFLISRPS